MVVPPQEFVHTWKSLPKKLRKKISIATPESTPKPAHLEQATNSKKESAQNLHNSWPCRRARPLFPRVPRWHVSGAGTANNHGSPRPSTAPKKPIGVRLMKEIASIYILTVNNVAHRRVEAAAWPELIAGTVPLAGVRSCPSRGADSLIFISYHYIELNYRQVSIPSAVLHT